MHPADEWTLREEEMDAMNQPEHLDLADAFQIVLDLARQNIIAEADNPAEHARQTEACNMLEDLAVNEFGDED